MAEQIGGKVWNPMIRGEIGATWPFRPLVASEMAVYEVLDHITAAVESGELTSETWPERLFASEKELLLFLEELSSYDDCYRITDRWWFALAELAGFVDEEGFIDTRDIADELERAYDELKERRMEAVAA